MLFSEKRAAQVAAFFLFSAGGQLEILKLMKLMYLAERSSLAIYGEPIIGDTLFSMDNGPMLSRTLNHMNKFRESEPDGWDSWISDRQNYMLGMKREVKNPQEELVQLSDADLEILQKVWQEFGNYGPFELADLTHEICDEWENPKGSSIPIPYQRLLRVLGYDAEATKEIEERIESQRAIDIAFRKAAV